MPFNDLGFLGTQIEEVIRSQHIENKELYALISAINKFAHKIKYKFDIHNKDSQELIIGALYIKVLQSFQSVIILAVRGLEADSKAILRVQLEATFYLVAVCKDLNFAMDYIKGDEVERYRIIKRIQNDKDDIFSNEAKEYANKERLDELEKVIWRQEDDPLRIFKVAKKADMYDFYQLVYGTLSGDVHTNVRSLEKYYGMDESGEVRFLECVPMYKDTISVIVTAGSILTVALSNITNFFNLDYVEEIEKYIQRLREFDLKIVRE